MSITAHEYIDIPMVHFDPKDPGADAEWRGRINEGLQIQDTFTCVSEVVHLQPSGMGDEFFGNLKNRLAGALAYELDRQGKTDLALEVLMVRRRQIGRQAVHALLVAGRSAMADHTYAGARYVDFMHGQAIYKLNQTLLKKGIEFGFKDICRFAWPRSIGAGENALTLQAPEMLT